MMLMLAAAMFGMFFFLTLFVQNILGFSPLRAGLAFLPVSVIIAMGAGFASQLLPKWGPKPFMAVGAILAAVGLGWLTLTDVHSSYLGSILGPILVFGFGMGLQFVSLTLMAVSGVAPQEAGAASGILNATQQVGGSLGLSVLVTVFGTASRNEATDQVRDFLAQATPAQRLEFRKTGQLPSPWNDQVLTSGISSAFVVAAIFAIVAALIALFVIQVRADDLKRLQGGVPLVPGGEASGEPAGETSGQAAEASGTSARAEEPGRP
jgi:MFS family permease